MSVMITNGGKQAANGLFGMSGANMSPGAGQALATLYAQPANFANTLGNNYTSYTGGLASLGNNYANAFGAYGAGLGSLANARANERSNWYGSNAMAEAARQGAVGNIGAASLGAYGSAANSALGAWAANQQAYNQAMGQLGSSQMASDAALGTARINANAALGRARIGAGVLASLAPAFGGGGGGGNFSASGPGGSIASGSYSGRTGGGGGMLASLAGGFGGGGGGGGDGGGGGGSWGSRLDAQHYSSREMPSQMLNSTLGGLTQLSGQGYSASGKGMDQFYERNTFNEQPYQDMHRSLNSGYGTVGGQLGGVQRDLGAGFNSANSNVIGLWNNSLGNLPEFQTPAERERRSRAGAQEQQRTRDMAEMDFRKRERDLAMAQQAVAPRYYGMTPAQQSAWYDEPIRRLGGYI